MGEQVQCPIPFSETANGEQHHKRREAFAEEDKQDRIVIFFRGPYTTRPNCCTLMATA